MGVDLFPGPQYWGGGCGLIPRPSVLGMGVVSSQPSVLGVGVVSSQPSVLGVGVVSF